jgi:hypothetical protein
MEEEGLFKATFRDIHVAMKGHSVQCPRRRRRIYSITPHTMRLTLGAMARRRCRDPGGGGRGGRGDRESARERT